MMWWANLLRGAIVLGDICPGGLFTGGQLSGGFYTGGLLSGGFCPGTFCVVLIKSILECRLVYQTSYSSTIELKLLHHM